MSSFEETGLDPRLLRAISKRGLTTPTAVQSASIPKARPQHCLRMCRMRRIAAH
jgi:superfamily II DNA/RNA helicase